MALKMDMVSKPWGVSGTPQHTIPGTGMGKTVSLVDGDPESKTTSAP